MSGSSLKRRALSGLLWSLVQSWGGRAVTFVLFLVLARLLTPAELGLMAAVSVVIFLVALVAEQGFGDAIVQRQSLEPRDANAPFFVALATCACLVVAVVATADLIERWMKAPGLAPYLRVTALFAPVSTAYLFQEAWYRRALDFRPLALRMLVATLLSGAVGVALAMRGFGVWSLVVQSAVMTIVSAMWVWARPRWVPGRDANWTAFGEMARFSANVLGTRLLDFASTRVVEILIAAKFGVVALGLYAVGARVYQTLIQLLFGAVQSVSLGTFSRIAHDRSKMRDGYLATVCLASAGSLPLFVGIAAVAPELTLFLFGQRWADSANVMRPLMLLGALQCVQFMNGPISNALGRPDYLLKLNLLKATSVVTVLLLLPGMSVAEMTVHLALAPLVATPASYWIVIRLLDLRLKQLASRTLPFALAAAAGYGVVHFLRPLVTTHVTTIPIASALLLGSAFALTYAIAALSGLETLRADLACIGLGRAGLGGQGRSSSPD